MIYSCNFSIVYYSTPQKITVPYTLNLFQYILIWFHYILSFDIFLSATSRYRLEYFCIQLIYLYNFRENFRLKWAINICLSRYQSIYLLLQVISLKFRPLDVPYMCSTITQLSFHFSDYMRCGWRLVNIKRPDMALSSAPTFLFFSIFLSDVTIHYNFRWYESFFHIRYFKSKISFFILSVLQCPREISRSFFFRIWIN